MRDYEAVFEACEGVDCVFHVAACGMSGSEQASTVFLKFSLVIFEKEKNRLHITKNVIVQYLYQTEVYIKAKSPIQEIKEAFSK